jgi:ATP-dependent helicase HepA
MSLTVGQRYVSLAEPELGLGVVQSGENKTVVIHYPDADETRRYSLGPQSPLKRVLFNVGEKITFFDDDDTVQSMEVQKVFDSEGLMIYCGSFGEIPETWIKGTKNPIGPFDRLRKMNIDSDRFFQLRRSVHGDSAKLYQSSERGLFGGRVDLLPHQLYVANTITELPRPRAMIADEVGLGKTITTGLVLYRLLKTMRSRRVLIILPDSLVHQWFVEMHKKFQMSFHVITKETPPMAGENPFLENDLVIVSYGLIRGAKAALELLQKAPWDVLVFDEIHKIDLSEEHPCHTYLRELALKTEGLLLLSATPLQGGSLAHFQWLKLLDQERFVDFEDYRNTQEQYGLYARFARLLIEQKDDQLPYKELENFWPADDIKDFKAMVKRNRNEAITELKDRHGLGRVYFRNTRKQIGEIYQLFKPRTCFKYELESLKEEHPVETKLKWLIPFLKDFCLEKKGEKILLLAKSKEAILEIEARLLFLAPYIDVALFHSGLTPLERDQQVARFLDPKGADLMLCTEVGSEGRNFEFARHLILIDLPDHPDKLEQRIGRLDRIGQKNTISIHVPLVKDHSDMLLMEWYDQGLEIFTRPCPGADLLSEEMWESQSWNDFFASLSTKDYGKLIEKTKKRRSELLRELEEGRDYLVELNSFDRVKGEELRKEISLQQNQGLLSFLEQCFETFAVDIEELSDTVFYVRPSENMLVPSYPYLTEEGLSFTFDRDLALVRHDLEFMTWDHPLVLGSFDLVLGSDLGMVNVAQWRDPKVKKTILETFFTFRCPLPKSLRAERFVKNQMIRLLSDAAKQEYTDKYSFSEMNEKLSAPSKDKIGQLAKLTTEHERLLLGQAEELAGGHLEALKEEARASCTQFFQREKDRLLYLSKKSGQKRLKEKEILQMREEIVLDAIDNAELQLDALRLIF